MFGYVLLALVCIAIGIFMAIKPDICWEITESWKSKDADGPSDRYCRRVRGAGIFLAGAMAVLLFLFLCGVIQ